MHIYDVTIASYIKYLTAMQSILDKAETWAKEHAMSDTDILESRLAPDQFPLVKQIQIMSDQAKASAAALAQIENPSFPDEEKTLAEIKERVIKTIAFLETVKKEAIDESTLTTRIIPYKWVPGKGFTAYDYAIFYSVPNFFFHYTTAYAILRHLGVQIGKMDYTHNLPLIDIAA
jgi:hypothetical protein